MHDEDYLFAFIHQIFDRVSDGVDVVEEGLDVWRTGTCAGEWNHDGWVVVFCVEDVHDFGEGCWALPESGDEDESRFGHHE